MAALLAMTATNISAKEPQTKKEIGIVAHRGYWNCEEGGHARNSLAALRAAQQAGFWGSEFDVNMTSDGVLLVYHDGHINGKRIDQNPYSEFQDVTLENGEKIPTVDLYLEQGLKAPDVVLVYELKKHSTPEIEAKLVESTAAKLKEYGLYDPAKVIFISFSRFICDKIAKEMPEFTVQYLESDAGPNELAKTGINGVDYNYKVYINKPEWLVQARRHGMSTNAWTVNKTERMEQMIDLGLDFITSDYPVELRSLLEAKGVAER